MSSMRPRRLGSTSLQLSPIGFGAFKIGRTEGAKYAEAYSLPSDAEATALVHAVLDLGITLIDTAPAYGVSEERVGAALRDRRADVVLSTKVGERFESGRSSHDFSEAATLRSVERSCARLCRATIDLVFVHSNGDDLAILQEGGVTRALRALRDRGVVRAIGFSGKTVEGHRRAIDEGYDALMVEYHPLDGSQRPALEEAADRGVGVVVKKALASGRVPPSEAVPFALAAPAVASVVIGSLRIDHLASCAELAGRHGNSP